MNRWPRRPLWGLNEDELHRLSHQPLRYLDHDHLVPEASHGRDAALLNFAAYQSA
ncbi:ethanolamine utilization cobalamin adenosyltransferase [Citrobacter koseri]|uniref:Ethanolamine utilization cobalamin adenosyltransferase n=1 Tax=Citrobacter koseri TaxID=545 RepID=A0A2X2VJ35_CITKO|nr:ethanolamine utilization cobalamin adenosyltransferase [Citrobacter koseri]